MKVLFFIISISIYLFWSKIPINSRSNNVESIIQNNFRNLISDFDGLSKEFIILDKGPSTWVKKFREKDLAKLIKSVRQLEFDINLMMGDCLFYKKIKEGKDITKTMQKVFHYLDILIRAVK